MTANNPEFNTSASRWNALTSRNPLASNAFIYSVLTTKIYCRPTCPSRLARRANIVFHDTTEQAESHGFRACMRCKPGTLSGEESDPQRIAVEKAKGFLAEEAGGKPVWSVKALATEVGLTESHFCRVFKKVEGCTIGEFRAGLQRERATVPRRTHSSVAVVPQKESDINAVSESALPQIVEQEIPTNFDGSELAQDWNDFVGSAHQGSNLDLAGMGFDLINFDFDFTNMEGLTPEMISDPSSPGDDGLQFLDFDGHHSPAYPSN